MNGWRKRNRSAADHQARVRIVRLKIEHIGEKALWRSILIEYARDRVQDSVAARGKMQWNPGPIVVRPVFEPVTKRDQIEPVILMHVRKHDAVDLSGRGVLEQLGQRSRTEIENDPGGAVTDQITRAAGAGLGPAAPPPSTVARTESALAALVDEIGQMLNVVEFDHVDAARG